MNHAWAYVTMIQTSSVELLMLCFSLSTMCWTGCWPHVLAWIFVEHVLLNLAVLNMFSVIKLCSTLQLVKLSDGWYILFTIYLVILFIYATKCSPICQSCMLRFTNWESRTTEDKSCHWCGNKMRTWHLHICETNDTVGEKVSLLSVAEDEKNLR